MRLQMMILSIMFTAATCKSRSENAGLATTRTPAKWGQMCANGLFGTPNIKCAEGLECRYPNGSTAPQGPDGSSSADTGKCMYPGAQVGEQCANGVFGTPSIKCAKGLECKYPIDSTTPQGPSESSSAATGTCVDRGAKKGAICANGAFGTPNIPCKQGLICKYPNDSSAPQGPDGGSSAGTGHCAEPDAEGASAA